MRVAIPLMLCLVAWSCSNESYNPDDYLTPKEKNAIVQTIVRYAAKAPENISFEERFNAKYDTFYREKASQIRFEQYVPQDHATSSQSDRKTTRNRRTFQTFGQR